MRDLLEPFIFSHELKPIYLLFRIEDEVGQHPRRQALIESALGTVLPLSAHQTRSTYIKTTALPALLNVASSALLANHLPFPVLRPPEEGPAGVAGDGAVVKTHLQSHIAVQ